MAKKKQPAGGGDVPEWVVTYGDLMSLLLTFFILLAAFSELKKEDEYQEVVESIKEAFGYEGGVGKISSKDPPANSTISQLQEIINRVGDEAQKGQSRTPSAAGPDPTSSYVADGVKTVVGTTVPFEAGSSEISETTQEYLIRDVVPKLRGLRFKIEVRGHAFGRADRAVAGDVDRMSFLRAKAVKDFLVTQGIESSRLVMTAVGSSEPISTNVADRTAMGQNRRVQVILTEVVPDEVNPDPNGTNPIVH